MSLLLFSLVWNRSVSRFPSRLSTIVRSTSPTHVRSTPNPGALLQLFEWNDLFLWTFCSMTLFFPFFFFFPRVSLLVLLLCALSAFFVCTYLCVHLREIRPFASRDSSTLYKTSVYLFMTKPTSPQEHPEDHARQTRDHLAVSEANAEVRALWDNILWTINRTN